MAEARNQGPVLSGWKGIAAYLKVSVRTAQNLERERGLPIRRVGGIKAPVSALTAELDEWQVSQTKCPNDVAVPELVVNINRRRWLWYAGGVVGSAGMTGLAFGGFRLSRREKPAAFRIQGSMLIVVGADGSELWRHVFRREIDDSWWTLDDPKVVFDDLDGDGREETLFHYVPRDRAFDGERSLVCFDCFGNLRWEFRNNKTVVDKQGRELVPPYWPGAVRVVKSRAAGRARIVVSSYSKWSYPNQVAVLDGRTGQVTSEYWHRGHLLHMALADLNGDGATEVLVAGVNDAPDYKRATLLVFDVRKINGCCCDPAGKPYFQGMTPGGQKNIVFFPKTIISEREEFNRVSEISTESDRITIRVAEGIDEVRSPTVLYEFDYRLRVTAVMPTDNFLNIYNQLPAHDRQESVATLIQRLQHEVRVI